MKKTVKKIISWIFIILIFFFLFKSLSTNWQEVKSYDFELNIYYLLLSFLLFAMGAVLDSQVWRFMLEKSGIFLSKWKGFRIHFLSRLGTYIPGKVWPLMMRIRMGEKEKISQKKIAIISFLEIAISLMAPSILALFFIGNYFLDKIYILILIIVVMAGLIIFFRPKIFYSILNFGLKKFKKEPISKEFQLTPKSLFVALFLNALLWIVWGAGFYFFVKAIINVSAINMINIIGIYIVSSTVGAWALFAPCGIGVREGIQAFLLKTIIPLEVAIVVSFSNRIWAILNDLIIALFIKIVDFFIKKNN